MQGEIPVCEIKIEDIGTEIDYWKHSVICYVLGAHPSFAVLNGFIQRLWEKWGINKVAMLQNGIVIVKFETATGKDDVVQGGIYHFDNKPFIVKAWSPEMEFTRDELHSVPIWVKLPGLDFKYWSPISLSKIGSLIEKPLMVDSHTEKKQGLNFARLLIEVDIDTDLPERVMFKNERGNLVEQKVQYGWRPIICKFCKKYGHNIKECRKNKPPGEEKD
ncbi:hypothetical protein KY289_036594 [Solanum tuberosum]|nr:hypothetical protein KY289_036594 [Solanum tuberosum]